MFITILLTLCAALSPAQLLVSPDDFTRLELPLAVDVRPEGQYLEGHVPGAAMLDPAILSEERGGVVGLLKPQEELTALLAKAGLDPARHIVIYTGMNDAGDLKNATRLLWILEYLSYPRVSILNGGYAKWSHEKRPVELGATQVKALDPEGLAIQPRPELLASHQKVARLAQSGEGVLVDCRSPEEYSGLSKKDFVRTKGHIPRAVSLPATDFVDGPFFEIKSGELLQALLTEANPKTGEPIVAYCNTGRDASVGYLGFRLGGFDQVSLYDGSMAEWSQLPKLGVE